MFGCELARECVERCRKVEIGVWVRRNGLCVFPVWYGFFGVKYPLLQILTFCTCWHFYYVVLKTTSISFVYCVCLSGCYLVKRQKAKMPLIKNLRFLVINFFAFFKKILFIDKFFLLSYWQLKNILLFLKVDLISRLFS